MKKKLGTITLLCITPTLFAFDCKQASTFTEKTICQSEELIQLDKTMSGIYTEIKNTGMHKNNLVRSQRSWLKQRDECQNQEQAANCMKYITEHRINDLSGKNSLNGRSDVFINITGENYNNPDENIHVFSYPLFRKPETPAMKKFNADMEDRYKPHQDNIMKYVEPAECDWSSADTTYQIHHYNGHYLGLETSLSTYGCGAAHGNHGVSETHFDLDKAAYITSAEALKPETLETAFQSCIDQLSTKPDASTSRQEYIDSYGDGVRSTLSSIDAWTLYPDNAVVSFSPYIAGSYAEGFLTCEFKKEDMEKFLAPYMLNLIRQ
ncbi:MAG TPA: lysozyme inhibitor LprI family protein [Pseudomonadales bacterium]|nr:lysozyme inhibitor LprI family protein [Pseudomonadales bacterium]